MVVADSAGIPLGVHLASATPAEVNLLEAALATVKVPRRGGGAPRRKPVRLIADRAYDADWLRVSLACRKIQLICPHRRGRTSPSLQDGRSLRRYRRRWIVERTIAWLQNFRRLVVRYERYPQIHLAFIHVACILITARQL
jgi:transposase